MTQCEARAVLAFLAVFAAAAALRAVTDLRSIRRREFLGPYSRDYLFVRAIMFGMLATFVAVFVAFVALVFYIAFFAG